MGGHGMYVWLSYVLTFVIIAYNIWVPIFKKGEIGKKIIRQSRRDNAGVQ
ncbi:MAG: heme exporter protein CcmD [Gammaproteobacteria bacterium]|nr:MAG: heme exporter protein CcmD [Gammaproteobacteria bacterium]